MIGTLSPNLEAAIELRGRGFWVHAVYSKGFERPKRGPASGKEPIGPGWGLARWSETKLRDTFDYDPAAGVGMGLGPDRAPGGGWLADMEGDGPEAATSLSWLLGGKTADTVGWTSRRGTHSLFVVDGDRLLSLLQAAGAKEGVADRVGVWHLDELPGLEIRAGGCHPDGIAKQVHSACPPTVGDDGNPRQWTGGQEIAALPETSYALLEAIGESRRVAAKLETMEAKPAAAIPFAGNGYTSHAGAWVQQARSALTSYSQAALADEISHFSSQGEGSRHAYLLASTMRLASFVKAGALTEAECIAGLKDAALSNGMGTGRFYEIDDAWQSARAKVTARNLSNVGGKSMAEKPGTTTAANVIPTFDSDPRPITAKLAPVPAIDPCMIPEVFRPWLQDIADRGCFPFEYVAATLLVVLGGLIGRKLAIRPKRYDDWTVVVNLWGAIVGPPGFLKTPAVEAVLRPLRRLVADAMKSHEDEIKEHNARLMVASARKGAAKSDLGKAAKKAGTTDDELQTLAKAAMADSTEEQPKCRRYLVSDFTVEKLGELLVENPNGLTIFRDELTGLLNTLNREGHQADRGFLLECWNGTGSYTFDRIQRGTIHIPAACLSVFGSIRPGPLARYMRPTISGEDADGFVPRFQVLVYPDPPETYVHVDRWPNNDIKNQAYKTFQALDQLNAADKGCKPDRDSGLPFVNFSDEAQQLFDQWYTELQGRLRSGELTDVMASHLAKYGSLMPSIALIFHLVDQCDAWEIGPVSLECAQMAAAWCELLEAHARRVYLLCADGDISVAASLAERIKESLPNPFTFRQVAQKGWTGLRTVEDVRAAVGVLEDRGWVKVVEVLPDKPEKGGRPSEVAHIHPKLRPANEGVDA